mgnify:CR=1 FL=1
MRKLISVCQDADSLSLTAAAAACFLAFLPAITVLMTGENRETAARMMNTQLMGRVKKVPTSPSDRIRARRKFF